MEAGYLGVAGRYFDVTNALIAWAGLGIGVDRSAPVGI